MLDDNAPRFRTPFSKDEVLKQIFDHLDTEKQGFISYEIFSQALRKYGLHELLLRDAVVFLKQHNKQHITFNDFRLLKEFPSNVIERALSKEVVIPDWELFTNELKTFYEVAKKNTTGTPNKRTRKLREAKTELFGVAVCTVDGQFWSCGDCDVDFPLYGVSKPITFCIAQQEVGSDIISRHVGHEPSGRDYESFELNEDNLPYNALVNSGFLSICALLKPDWEPADRFDFVMDFYSRALGVGKRVGFDNESYLAEMQISYRNFSLAHYMKDRHALPENVNIKETIEFFTQQNSILMTAADVACLGGTLASGGVSPVTRETIFQPSVVVNCLSLMFSCGMYDYSGEWAFTFGVPAKASISGAIMVVVPNVMGICTFSPRLNKHGISECGVEFIRQILDEYPIHAFDCFGKQKRRIFRQPFDQQLNTTAEMIYHASKGNLSQIQVLIGSGVSVNCADYDGRTPLHLAVAEGHVELCAYLMHKGGDFNAKDRIGETPLSAAVDLNRQDILTIFHSLADSRRNSRRNSFAYDSDNDEHRLAFAKLVAKSDAAPNALPVQ